MLALIISVISNADFFSIYVTCFLQQAISSSLGTERQRFSFSVRFSSTSVTDVCQNRLELQAIWFCSCFQHMRGLPLEQCVCNDGVPVPELALVLPFVLHCQSVFRCLSSKSKISHIEVPLSCSSKISLPEVPLVLVFGILRCASKEKIFRHDF